MIALRADHEVDHGLARDDLGPFGLGNATGDAYFQVGLGFFQRAEPAQFGIDLFGGLFADVAGVQQDQIGVFGGVRRHVTFAAKRLAHAFAVIDVHLTAVGLDEKLLRRGHPLAPGV